MSAGIVRLADLSQGHGYPPIANTGASSKCFCDGIGIHRLGDPWNVIHCIGPTCHNGGTAATASVKTFADGKGICRTGDSVSCGDTMLQSSGKCFST